MELACRFHRSDQTPIPALLSLPLLLQDEEAHSTLRLQEHGYLVASSGSGKSELIKVLLYRELILKEPKSSVIVIDPHGDLVEEIVRMKPMAKRHISNRVVYIDPSLHADYTPSINPFEIADRSERNIALMTQELRSIFEVLLQDANTTNQMPF